MRWPALVGLAALSVLTFPAHAQLLSDPVPEDRGADTANTAIELTSDFDFVDFVDFAMADARIETPDALANALVSDDACGGFRDGHPAAEPSRICALILEVYENEDGEWFVRRVPVFALEAIGVGRNVSRPIRSVFSITRRGPPGMVSFEGLLPRPDGQAVTFDGMAGAWRYSHAVVVGKRQNEREEYGIPPAYFDHKTYDLLHPG